MTPTGQKSPFSGGEGAAGMAHGQAAARLAPGGSSGYGLDGNSIALLHQGNLDAFLKGPRPLKVSAVEALACRFLAVQARLSRGPWRDPFTVLLPTALSLTSYALCRPCS
jgi:hypothetical protein